AVTVVGAVRPAQLEVEVRGDVLGVAGVADPADQLAGLDPRASLDARCDAPALPVVGVGPVGPLRVVVEVDVPGDPAVGVPDAEVATLGLGGGDPDDLAGRGGHHGHALLAVGHDVRALVRPLA